MIQFHIVKTYVLHGWIPEWPKGTDCKSAANCFGGSNPPPSIELCIFTSQFFISKYVMSEEAELSSAYAYLTIASAGVAE